MSTATDPAAATSAPAIPRLQILSEYKPAASRSFGRLLRAEFRKIVDTLSGRVLLIVGSTLTLLIILANALIGAWYQTTEAGKGTQVSVSDAISGAAQVMTIFVAVLGVISVTNEWGQRTNLTTFALEPRRSRVLIAKVIASLTVVLVILALMIPMGYASVALAKALGANVGWRLEWKMLVGILLVALVTLFLGLAFGLLTLNTPAAVAIYFALPMVLSLASGFGMMWEPLGKVMKWLDPIAPLAHLTDENLRGAMQAEHWWQLLVANLVWVGIPFALGTWRWMRREVK